MRVSVSRGFVCFHCARADRAKHPDSRKVCVACFDSSARSNEERRERRNYNLLGKYGITAERYDQLVEEQHGCCAICFERPKKRRLAVDHNHDTGEIRGLLCTRCNMGLGYMRDNPELVRRAADYLEGAHFQPDGLQVPLDEYQEEIPESAG